MSNRLGNPDPRALALAIHRQRLAHEESSRTPDWDDLNGTEQEAALREARLWLRAAIEAGITPAAERPSDKHDAVYVDDEGLLYGEYRTVPPSDSIVRLVWASDKADSKEDLEHHGAEFRLIGWSH